MAGLTFPLVVGILLAAAVGVLFDCWIDDKTRQSNGKKSD